MRPERSRCRPCPDAKNPGDSSGEAIPVPIPNTEVKLSSAEDTERAAFRENRSSPGFLRFLRGNRFVRRPGRSRSVDFGTPRVSLGPHGSNERAHHRLPPAAPAIRAPSARTSWRPTVPGAHRRRRASTAARRSCPRPSWPPTSNAGCAWSPSTRRARPTAAAPARRANPSIDERPGRPPDAAHARPLVLDHGSRSRSRRCAATAARPGALVGADGPRVRGDPPARASAAGGCRPARGLVGDPARSAAAAVAGRPPCRRRPSPAPTRPPTRGTDPGPDRGQARAVDDARHLQGQARRHAQRDRDQSTTRPGKVLAELNDIKYPSTLRVGHGPAAALTRQCWQPRQYEVTKPPALTSVMRVPQRGHGWPPLMWTARKSRTCFSNVGGTRSRRIATAEASVSRVARRARRPPRRPGSTACGTGSSRAAYRISSL